MAMPYGRKQAESLSLRKEASVGGKAASFAAPSDPEAQLAIADFYESVGNTEKVIHALRRALYIDPDNRHIQQRLRGYGVIPGPTAALAPTP